MRRSRITLTLLLMALASCGKDDEAPLPVAPPTDLIANVAPAPWSRSIPTATEIWSEFTEALDPASVSTSTVRLKADTRRIAMTVWYEAATRRIHVVPDQPLVLRQTYTIEITEAVTTVSGAHVPAGYFWQFTTIAVRTPQSPLPWSGKPLESPFVLLQWEGLTEASAGASEYEVRMATDSATAVDSTTTPIAVVTGGRYLPRGHRWSQVATNWWSVRAHNKETGEHVSSPAWSFDCFPADAPVDTVDLSGRDYAWYNTTTGTNRPSCFGDSVVSGNLLIAYMRWQYPFVDSTRRLADAWLEISPYARYQASVQAGASIWPATSDWSNCTIVSGGAPFVDEDAGPIAQGEILQPDRVRFRSEPLTAHIEANGRWGGYPGYVLRSSARVAWYTTFGTNFGRLRVVVFRAPAVPPAAATVRAIRRAPRTAPGGTGSSRPLASSRPAARDANPRSSTSR
jgi:hypothetical protein